MQIVAALLMFGLLFSGIEAQAASAKNKIRAVTTNPGGAEYDVQFCQGPIDNCGESGGCANLVTIENGIKTFNCVTSFKPKSAFVSINNLGGSSCAFVPINLPAGPVNCGGTSVKVGAGKF